MNLIVPSSSKNNPPKGDPAPKPDVASVAEAMSPATPAPAPPKATAPEIIAGCTIDPLGPQIVVLRDPPDERSKGGIVLPNQTKNRARSVTRGTVVRVGTGFLDHTGKTHACPVNPGDRIVFQEFAGTDIEHPESWGTQLYTLMQQGEILARVGNVLAKPAS